MEKLVFCIPHCSFITRKNFVETVKETMRSYDSYIVKILETSKRIRSHPADTKQLEHEITLLSHIPEAATEAVSFIDKCTKKYPHVWYDEGNPGYDERKNSSAFLECIKESLLCNLPKSFTKISSFMFYYLNSFTKLFPLVRDWLLLPANRALLKGDATRLFSQLMTLINYGVMYSVAISERCN